MEKVKDLKDLLTNEIQDLYSVEEQIIDAMPQMIDKAGSPQLKEQLQQHLRITEEHRNRLERIKQLMAESVQEQGDEGEQKHSFLANLFNRNKEQKCLGMEGIIREGKKMLDEPMEPQVVDAAIVACAQKIEHYEICGYGTARAYARELNLRQVADLLEETLNEEYEADDRLTELAVGRLNEEAEGRRGGSRTQRRSRSGAGSKSAAKGASRGGASKGGAKSASKGGSKSASKGSSKRGAVAASKGTKTAVAKKGGQASRGGASKGAAKKGASKTAAKGRGSIARKGPSKAAASKGGRNARGGRGR